MQQWPVAKVAAAAKNDGSDAKAGNAGQQLDAGLAASLFYAVMGTIIRPELWADPIGPMLKIWPIMVLILAALALRNDR